MIVIKQHRIYRTDLRNNPTVLYLFGDNLSRKGMGGQAAEMRGEPNAFGIATKRSISHNFPDDYFFDQQMDVKRIIDQEFKNLQEFIEKNKDKFQQDVIIVPADGIGTGLAKMPEYAPNMLAYINQKLRELEIL